VTASLLNPSANAGLDAAGDQYLSIENLTGSSGTDHLTGDEQANVIKGLDGDDTLVGGGGKDTLDGGRGKDYVSYQDQDQYSTTGVVVSLAGQPAENGGVTFVNVEGLIGSKWADQLTGAATDSALDGRAGDDVFVSDIGSYALPCPNLADFAHEPMERRVTQQFDSGRTRRNAKAAGALHNLSCSFNMDIAEASAWLSYYLRALPNYIEADWLDSYFGGTKRLHLAAEPWELSASGTQFTLKINGVVVDG
jgi:Ca2+-binding RTX toxin-like protein